jgi:hypothetical protein
MRQFKLATLSLILIALLFIADLVLAGADYYKVLGVGRSADKVGVNGLLHTDRFGGIGFLGV